MFVKCITETFLHIYQGSKISIIGKFKQWRQSHIHDDLDFDPTQKLNAHHLIDEANMADAATSSNRGRKRHLTDSAWKRKKKETNALINKIKDLRRRRVWSLERFKTHIAVFYSPQLVPLAHVLSDVSLNNAAI